MMSRVSTPRQYEAQSMMPTTCILCMEDRGCFKNWDLCGNIVWFQSQGAELTINL
jgi:hypothetical protein